MGLTKARLAIAGIVAAGLLIGGTAALRHRGKPDNATVAAPAASVPGYNGPLYDAQGKLVGYAQPPETDSQPSIQPTAGPPAAAPQAAPAGPAPHATAHVGKKPRSTRKSAAIVAGTAGFGAAIGALAGGGPGAAIGALSGGGAGYVYDRVTHKR